MARNTNGRIMKSLVELPALDADAERHAASILWSLFSSMIEIPPNKGPSAGAEKIGFTYNCYEV